MDKEKIVIIESRMKGLFAEMSSGDFCGCDEGDLTGAYDSGVECVLKELHIILIEEGVE